MNTRFRRLLPPDHRQAGMAVYRLSMRAVAVLDRWQQRRSAIRAMYGVSREALFDIGCDVTWELMSKRGVAPGLRRTCTD